MVGHWKNECTGILVCEFRKGPYVAQYFCTAQQGEDNRGPTGQDETKTTTYST